MICQIHAFVKSITEKRQLAFILDGYASQHPACTGSAASSSGVLNILLGTYLHERPQPDEQLILQARDVDVIRPGGLPAQLAVRNGQDRCRTLVERGEEGRGNRAHRAV